MALRRERPAAAECYSLDHIWPDDLATSLRSATPVLRSAPMSWEEAIDGFATYLAAAGARPNTIDVRTRFVRFLARMYPDCDWRTLDGSQLVTFMATPGWAPETRAAARTSVRVFYTWAREIAELIERSPAVTLPKVKVPPTVPKPCPDLVLAAALDRADDRGRLMLLLGADAGLRRAEIAAAHSSWNGGDLLYVEGKGGRIRMVPLSARLAENIPADIPAGFYFPGGVDGHLQPGRVGKIIAGLLGGGWTAHSLRHRFATRAYAVDHDLLAVQQLLGHSTPDVTTRYTAIPPDNLRRAVDGLGGVA